MGLLDRFHKKKPETAAKPTLPGDIPKAPDWPVRRAMKRLRNGAEDGLYVCGRFAAGTPEETDG